MNFLTNIISNYGMHIAGIVALGLTVLAAYRSIQIRLASRDHTRKVTERWHASAQAAIAERDELRTENRRLRDELARVRDFYGVVTTGLQAENNRLQQSSLH